MVLTPKEERELQRLTAEESARVGYVLTVSDFVRRQTFERKAA
jgi:hypothetical protein